MLGQATQLGCQANDAKCLCQNQNFAYGIRDCSYQSCNNETAAAEVVSYGVAYCSGKFALENVWTWQLDMLIEHEIEAGVTVPTSVSGHHYLEIRQLFRMLTFKRLWAAPVAAAAARRL